MPVSSLAGQFRYLGRHDVTRGPLEELTSKIHRLWLLGSQPYQTGASAKNRIAFDSSYAGSNTRTCVPSGGGSKGIREVNVRQQVIRRDLSCSIWYRRDDCAVDAMTVLRGETTFDDIYLDKILTLRLYQCPESPSAESSIYSTRVGPNGGRHPAIAMTSFMAATSRAASSDTGERGETQCTK